MNTSVDILAPDVLAGTQHFPGAYGRPLARAVMKSRPGDFRVDELLDLTLGENGEHLWLLIRKTGLDTDTVCTRLQAICQVGSADVGIAGRKDRHAITTQWISVRTVMDGQVVAAALADSVDGPDEALTVVEARRHGRKLRHGAHDGNGFAIVLRSIEPLVVPAPAHDLVSEDVERSCWRDEIDARLTLIARDGFVNYLGPQRFGVGGRNLVRARQWLAPASGRKSRRVTRLQRSLWLSAARSALFNQVCAARVEAGSWQHPLPGEPCMLAGSRSFFQTGEPDAVLARRLEEWDIHPSAPWWGRGSNPATGACLEFESSVLVREGALKRGLEQAGLPQERRALRARPEQLAWTWADERTLELTFVLEKGVFATTMLATFAELQEQD